MKESKRIIKIDLNIRLNNMYKMPKKNIDWSKSVIYRILCNDPVITDDYIGSTTNFIQRSSLHKTSCEKYKTDIKLYSIIRIHGGWNNWKIVILEEFPCQSRQQLLIREQYWINNLHPRLNSMNAYIEQKIDNEQQQKILYELQINILEKRKELLLLENKYKEEQQKLFKNLELD
jgi:hypothetical protein